MRKHCRSSKHSKGKAVDLAFCPHVIQYLVSNEGKAWLKSHNLDFYIEGKPGSVRVKYYESIDDTSEYVFYNKRATGDHLHLFLI